MRTIQHIQILLRSRPIAFPLLYGASWHSASLPRNSVKSTHLTPLCRHFADRAAIVKVLHRPRPRDASLGPLERPKGTIRGCTVETLDPAKLTPACFHDLSGKSYQVVRFTTAAASAHPDHPTPSDRVSRLVYFFDSTRMTPGVPSKAAAHIPFPAGTAGFFYFHRPAGAPPAAGEVRFRITRDADPGSFAAGADLRVHGLPWAMDVYPPVQNVRAVFPLLLADGLLAPRELARIEAMAAARPLGHRLARLVYAFGEPFAVRLDVQRRGSRRIMLSVSVLGDEGDTPINLQFTNLGYISPTSGERRTFTADTAHLVVHFEEVSGPIAPMLPRVRDAASRPKAVLRVRQALRADGSPVVPGEHADAEAAGALLAAGPGVWHRMLDDDHPSGRALRLLRHMPEGTFD